MRELCFGLRTTPGLLLLEASLPSLLIAPELVEMTRHLPGRLQGEKEHSAAVLGSTETTLDQSSCRGFVGVPPKDTFTSRTSECDLIEKVSSQK